MSRLKKNRERGYAMSNIRKEDEFAMECRGGRH